MEENENENMEENYEDLSDMSFSKEIYNYDFNDKKSEKSVSLKKALISIIRSKDEDSIKKIISLAIDNQLINESEVFPTIQIPIPNREERINRRRHSFTISEEYSYSSEKGGRENNRLSVTKYERKKIVEKDLLNPNKKLRPIDLKEIKIVESRKFDDSEDISQSQSKSISQSHSHSHQSQSHSHQSHSHSYQSQSHSQSQSNYNSIINSQSSSSSNNSFNNPLRNSSNQANLLKMAISNSTKDDISLTKLIEENDVGLAEYLRSGEVEPVYENYLRLYHELEEFNKLEILNKEKKKKAKRIYEQFIKKNAENKSNNSLLFKKLL